MTFLKDFSEIFGGSFLFFYFYLSKNLKKFNRFEISRTKTRVAGAGHFLLFRLRTNFDGSGS